MGTATLGVTTEEERAAAAATDEVDVDTRHKVCTLIDTNLFSGSFERMRETMGGFFYVSDDSDTSKIDLDFKEFSSTAPINESLHWVQSFRASHLQGSGESTIQIPEENQNSNTIIPNKHFVCKVDGHPEVVKDDKMWKILWTGGIIDDVSYEPLYNEGTYSTFYTTIRKPYPKIESRKFSNPEDVTNYAEISYDYLAYRENYQDYVSGLDSELLIPNWYINKWAGLYADSSDDLRTEIYNIISYNGSIIDPWEYFNTPPTTSSAAEFVGQYLDLAAASPAHSASTQDYAKERLKNIMFNDNFFTEYSSYRDAILPATKQWEEGDPPAASMPYYAKISFPFEPEAEVFGGNIARGYDFDSRLLRLLKTTFLNQLPQEITPSEVTFTKYVCELSSSVNTEANDELKTIEDVNYRTINLIDLLLYSHAKIKCDVNDFTFVDSKNIATDSTYDTKGVYRAINVGDTLNVLDEIITEWKGGSFSMGGFAAMDMGSILNVTSNFLDSGGVDMITPKYNETVAYRIEKIGGSEGTESTIQNFWFYNSDKMNETFDFFDTQVKYDKHYTYKIYSYVIVYGIKYKYSNLQLSRIIGATGDATDSEGVEIDPESYCIEYYDPISDQAVPDLLTAGRETYGIDSADAGTSGHIPISSLSTEAQRVAISEVDTSQQPYLANFLVTHEPDIQILEIPMFEKTIRIQDNPPNRLNILPSYAQNNTNQLSFLASYESYYSDTYPNTISAQDKINRDDYLVSKDFLPDTRLPDLESRSRQQIIEIYRTTTRPTSFEDFDGRLLKTIDMTDPTVEMSYHDVIFYDQVASNVKYYYLFRAVNMLGVPGYCNQILEAELIDDGGYKYALFDTLFEQDLEIDHHLQTTTDAKKVFQISPAIQQIALNTDTADFSDTAINQLSNVTVGDAEDLLWGKTFKIRLTSKKTNKQIDLNITYNQTTEEMV